MENEPEYVIRPVILRRGLIPQSVLDGIDHVLTIGKMKHGDKATGKFTHETIEEVFNHLVNHMEAYDRGELIDKDGFYHTDAIAVRALQLSYLHKKSRLEILTKEG